MRSDVLQRKSRVLFQELARLLDGHVASCLLRVLQGLGGDCRVLSCLLLRQRLEVLPEGGHCLKLLDALLGSRELPEDVGMEEAAPHPARANPLESLAVPVAGRAAVHSGRAAALAARPLHVVAVAYSWHVREHGLRNHDAERIERQHAKTRRIHCIALAASN